jgi:4-hydroxy-tetrahydrodipicolinate synthase
MYMDTNPMRGVYPILITPFDEAGRIDEDSLRSLVEFNLVAGVHGLGIALGSEVFKLADAERDVVTRIIVDQVNGRVPVVVNTSAAGTNYAVMLSQAAARNGADALMVMPPSFTPAGQQEVLDYYREISNAVEIPIFIQDTSTAPVSPGMACRIAEECRWVRYIKVENLPAPLRVAEMVTGTAGKLIVFGGAGGDYFIEEMRRGSQGTMPFCTQPEAFVKVWNLFQNGEEAAARQVFTQVILPVNRLAGQGVGIIYTVHKEILRRRGIIRSAKVRSPAPPMDEDTRRELDRLIDELYE